jgi:hypothetical protein
MGSRQTKKALNLKLNLPGAQHTQFDLRAIQIKLRDSSIHKSNHMLSTPIPDFHFATLTLPANAAKQGAKL